MYDNYNDYINKFNAKYKYQALPQLFYFRTNPLLQLLLCKSQTSALIFVRLIVTLLISVDAGS
jgi:hypothetical protein